MSSTIGNIVSELHIHIIARYKNDKLFPKPVWGCEPTYYASDAMDDLILQLKTAMANK